MVIHNNKQIEISNLPEGYYFILKKTHDIISGPRYKKLELTEAINKRNWDESETIVEEASFRYLNPIRR